jgi:hypothetical protein
MYVKFPGGRRSPGGYVVPCELIRKIGNTGWIVLLSDEACTVTWQQYVRNNQLISDEEAERDEV